MEEVISKQAVPELPEGIKIQYAGRGSMPSQKIKDISKAGIQDIIQKVRSGKYASLLLSPDGEELEQFLMLESSPDLLFLQIWEGDTETAWSCFDPATLDSEEDAPIVPSDKQSVIPMRNTIPNTAENRELLAQCVEWYIHTCGPYPGMEWLKAND